MFSGGPPSRTSAADAAVEAAVLKPDKNGVMMNIPDASPTPVDDVIFKFCDRNLVRRFLDSYYISKTIQEERRRKVKNGHK